MRRERGVNMQCQQHNVNTTTGPIEGVYTEKLTTKYM